MEVDKNLQYIVSTALQVGNYDTALFWLESLNRDHVSGLILPDQRTPLHYACQHGRVDVAQRLITNCRCSIESKDVQGCTPLHTAAQYGQVETLKFLLQYLFTHDFAIKLQRGKKLSQPLKSKFDQLVSDRHRDQRGNTPLHTACIHGQINIVHPLAYEFGCNTQKTNCEGLSCLHLAAQHGHLLLVRYLMEEVESDLNLDDVHGRSPAYLAAGEGHLDILEYLIKGSSAVANFKTTRKWESQRDGIFISYGRSLVHVASREGHLHVVKYLVEHHGCDPSSKDGDGITALYLACQQGHMNIVSYLITEANCDPKYNCDEKGTTCLHAAANEGRLDVVKYLHKHNCQAVPDCNENMPLHIAAHEGKLDVLKYLIEDMNCDASCKGLDKRTPLHFACISGHMHVVRYLVDKWHCDLVSPDKDKITPLHCAAAYGQLEVVKFFIADHQCSPSVRNAFKNAPLHYAATYGRLDVVKYFIEVAKCKPNLKGRDRETPLHLACKNGHLEVVKYLVETHNCDPLCQDKNKRTPIHRAVAHLEVAKYFVNKLGNKILVPDDYNKLPFHYAVSGGHYEVVKFLVENLNINPSDFKQTHGETPLFDAVAHERVNVCKYLVDLENSDLVSKVDTNFIETDYVLKAVEKENLEIIKYICANCRLERYLHMQGNKTKLIKSIKRTLNYHNIYNLFVHYEDPLHCAARKGDIEKVKLLVESRKWCPGVLDRHGNNAFHTAAEYGQLEVVKYFAGLNINEDIEALCDPLAKNKSGLSAQDLASREGHDNIVSYLLRTTSMERVFQQDIISPPLNVFVVGNSKSGKSTLIKALSTENGIVGKVVKVKGVAPDTAGIVPTTIHNPMFGEVNFYDFAGQEEHYASHEVILQQTAQPLVLLTVDISLSKQKVEKQIRYWAFLLSNTSPPKTRTIHIVIIGSHADLLRQGNVKKEMDLHVKELMNDLQDEHVRDESYIKYHEFIQCDCRYPTSSNLDHLRQKFDSIGKSIRFVLANSEPNSHSRNSYSAALMHYLKHSRCTKPTITVSQLHTWILASAENSTLNPFVDKTVLLQTCKDTSSNGHILFLPHNKDEQESVLILDKAAIKLHACFKECKAKANNIGVLEESKLKSILSDFLKDIPMEPDLAIKYLIFSQFCTEITADQLITTTSRDVSEVVYYFFPNLASASRPDDLVPSGDSNYTCFYTWGLKCTSLRHFFTPRFLHTLFVQLAKCERDNVNAKFTIWKKGILLAHHNGTRSIIEVTDQKTRLYLAMQCLKGHELLLVEQRSKLISLMKSLLATICPKVKHTEYLLHPDTLCPFDGGEELPLADVAQSVVRGYPTVLVAYKDGTTPKHVKIKDLLHFDPFHAIEDEILQDIFRCRLSTNVISPSTSNAVCSLIEGKCEPLARKLALTRQMTCKQLYENLIMYSIFSDNLYVS